MATIDEAIDVLTQLGFPRAQLNERSGLTLLALADLTPTKPWVEADAPLRGITPMMDFMAAEFDKRYAPNTRETVRRQTVHQFVAAGLVLRNPDDAARPVNSAKTTYQINPEAVGLLRSYGTPEWPAHLARYSAQTEALAERWKRERDRVRIPVVLPDGQEMSLSPGGQNVLIAELIAEFCPVFTPGGRVLYVGDANEKFAIFDESGLRELGVAVEQHGKMPDLIVYDPERNWLVLVEAVTSHGPVDPKRHDELRELFAASRAGLVFVTAFLDRRSMAKYLPDISWETEVWVAADATHLIHFDGERFLGPYAEPEGTEQ